MSVNSTTTSSLILLACWLFATPLSAQCGGGPCDAMRYERGSAWNPNGTVDDSPQANGGIIRCGNSAETQSNIKPNSCYDPTVFTVTTMNCIDPDNGQAITLTNPVAGQPVTWFNFDVRAFSSNFDFQVVSNDNLGWALYRSTTSTMPPPNGSLSGNCQSLVFNSCGTNFNGWAPTPFQNLDFPFASNFYLVVWNMDYNAGDPGSGALNFNFKARYSCGEQLCSYQIGEKSVQCNGSTYTVTIPITGNNVTLTAADPLANTLVYSPNPLTLTNPGANNPVTMGTVTATYSVGEAYNIVITPTSSLGGCSPTTVAGYGPPACCPINITCPAPVTVQCASLVPAPNPGSVLATSGCTGNTGNCGAFCTYTQGGYGNAGGTHSNGLNTTQTLDSLLQSGPIVIGGGTGNCGFQLTTTACILGILPGGGPSQPLLQNFVVDCAETIDNTLVGQLVTLQLNIRYNLKFNNNLNLANAPLSCVLTPAQITALGLPATAKVSDLIVLANTFLASYCNGTTYANGFGGQLTSALSALNEFWDECPSSTGNTPPVVTFVSDVISNQTCPNRYTITRTYKATNATGNTATCTQVITVYDNTAPTITCPAAITVNCPSDVPAPNPNAIITSDNCSGPVTVTFIGDVSSNQNSTITRTYQAADACGNTATCTQVITILLVNSIPTLTCPAPVTVQCAAQVPAPNPTAVGIGNACLGSSITVVFVGDVISGQTCTNRFTITRTYKATDSYGNMATCTQTITVYDNTAPILSAAPANVTVQCNAVPPAATLTATDNCDVSVTVTPSSSITPGSCPDAYTIVRVWIAADNCGNTASVSQTITVIDNTPPVLSAAPANVTVQCNAVPPAATLTATDNCDVSVTVTPSSSITPGSCPDAYTIVRVWIAADNCGNTASVSQTITVIDNTPPVLSAAPANVTVQCNAVPPAATLTATDNCDVSVTVTPSSSITPGSCPDAYTIVRVWIAADNCGNTASVSQTITVIDNTPPVLSAAPANVTVQCNAVPPAATLTATDNCDVSVTVTPSSSITPGACPDAYTIIRVWIAADNCGNTASVSQTITVVDNTPPVLSAAPANVTVQCNAVPPAATLTATDNCDVSVTVTPSSSITPGSCPDAYTIVRVWIAADNCGNTASVSQTITVIDNTPPVLSAAPANVTVQCNAVPPAATLTATDNCDVSVTVTPSSSITPGSCPDAYTIVRVWIAADNCGNTASVSQTITVIDNTPPVLSAAPANVTVQCNAVPPAATLTATDNCDVSVTVTPSSSITPGSCPDAYTIVRVWIAADNCGNTASVSQTITVIDNTPPVLSAAPANVTVQCNAVPPAATLTATDNCDVSVTVTPSSSITPGSCPDAYTIVRVWIAADNCGNTASVSQTITVVDNTPPVLSAAPANVTVQCNAVPPAATLTATDNCDVSVTVTPSSSITPGSCPDAYTIVRVWIAADNCGNTASVSQTITVVDNTPPVLSAAPANVTVQCNAVPPAATLTATDNCDVSVTVTPSSSITPGSCPDAYTIIRVWIAADNCGNTASVSQTITVVDNTPPVLSAAPANVTVQCNAVPPAATLTATDNCDVSVTVTPSSSITPGSCPDAYTIVRVWIAADNCGNTASVSQTITVIDNTPPVLSAAPANVTVQCNAVPPAATLTATDNCDVSVTVTPSSSITPGSCPDAYTIVRVWIAADNCGNTASVSQTITVIDNTPPVLSAAPANVTVQCNAVPPAATLTATDNCDVSVTVTPSSSITPGACPDAYTIIRVWIAADNCGNTASVSQTITVIDNTPPVLSAAPANVTVQCNAVPPAATLTATDNCDVSVTVTPSSSITPGSCPDAYTIVRVWIAADNCGNTASVSQTITVIDNTPPVVTCPAPVTVNCPSEVPPPNPGSVVASDNCGGTVTVIFVSDVPSNQGATIIRTYQGTDACGNSATCTQVITVLSTNTLPTITCPAPVTVECASLVPAPDPASVVAIGSCGTLATVTFVGDVVSNLTCLNRYTITRTYRATDGAGNSVTCTQTINVYDNKAPILTCPAPITVDCPINIPLPNTGTVLATDNCGGTATVVFVDDVTINQGTTVIRTYRATDECGNSATCSQTITILLTNNLPTLTCPASITVECASQVPAPDPTLVGTTNSCTGATPMVSFLNDVISYQVCPNRYMITRTYQATDGAGNTVTCTQLITVFDDTAPTITCPAPVTVECTSLLPVANPAIIEASDNCGGTPTVIHLNDVISNEICSNSYTVTRIYQATDACGNTAVCTQAITVLDNKAPTITCPANLTVSCIDDVPEPDPAAATATDNCGSNLIIVNFVGDVISNQGTTIVRTYQAGDGCGNTSTCTQTITILSTSNVPYIQCPNPITVQCASDVPAPDPSIVGTSNNCGGPAATVSFINDVISYQVCPNRYMITRTYQASDGAGNVATCTQLITVFDNTAPVITCPAAITVQCNGQAPAPSTNGIVATDNCTGTVTVTFVSDVVNVQTSITTRTYMATDLCGNTATCTQLITVYNNSTPTITCPAPVTVQCASLVPAPNIALVTATSTCGNSCGSFCTYTQGAYGSAGGTHSNGLNTTQTLDILLQSGPIIIGTGTCGFQVATTACVLGILPAGGPSIPLVQNYVLDCSQTINNTLVGQLITLQLNVRYNLAFNNNLNLGTAALTCVLTPAEIASLGLSASATVNDLILLSNTFLGSNCNGTTYANGFGGLLTAATSAINEYWDECQNPGNPGAAPTVMFVSDVISNQTCINRYTITRTYKATDANGNTATCTQVITVYDNTAPVITCPAAVTVSCPADVPAANPAGVVATDNCSGTVTVTFVGDVTSNQGATIIRTYQATDACGNTATCTQTITIVLTNNAPNITCPNPVTVQCASQVPAPDPTSVGATSNCGGAATATVVFVSDVISNQTCINRYTIVRTYKATDANGNTATCTQVITVYDNTAPVLSAAPANVTVQCNAVLPQATLTATDNCTGTVTLTPSSSITPGSCPNAYTIVRVWTATDVCGLTASVSQTVTVIDNTPPVITCPAPITLECNEPTPAPAPASVVATDNCIGTVTVTFVSDVINVQTSITTRTYMATDLCGNTATCTQLITVYNNSTPTITCPAPVTVQCASLVPAPNIALVTATSTCGNSCGSFCTYTQGGYGSAGGTHSNGLNTTQTLDILLQSGPIIIGTGTCGFQVATTACVLGILPAGGPSIPLVQNYVLDCSQTINNTLVGQLITLQLNVRYNLVFNNNLSLGTAALTCVLTPAEIASLGLSASATVNDLILLSNTFLGSNCNGTTYANGFGGQLTAATSAINEYWDECQNPGNPGAAPTVMFVSDVISNQTCINRYTITRTYKATDANGNTATCTQVITVYDNTAPVITCPAAVTVSCPADVPAANPAGVVATDNCSGTVTVTFVGDVTSNQGATIIRTYQATDACGNTATCTQTITIVLTNNAPNITCPNPVTVQCASQVPAPDPTSVGATSNCGGAATATVVFVSDVISNQTCINRYTIVRTYKATDANGNTATCTQVITVYDNTAPVLSAAPANVTVQCNAVLPQATLTATDNCTGTVTVTPSSSITPGSCPNAYTIVRVWTATDVCGLTASVSQTVTVIDNTPPVITCPAPITLECDEPTPAPAPASVVATDNCTGTVTVVFVSDVFNIQNSTVTRTYMATDVCGNTATCTQLITILTTGNVPVITCPAPVTVQCASNVPAPDINSVIATGGCGNSCGSFCTYTQGGYGSAGGTHSNGLNTTQTLDILLQSGPIIIGTGTCGFQVATTACVLGILPAGGPSIPLVQNYVLDCSQTINNTLVGQLITLQLNVRYNLVFNNNLSLGTAALTCVLTPAEIASLGLSASATVNDLILLSNTFLGSNCNGTTYANGFGGQLTAATSAINEYWDECQNPGNPGAAPTVMFVSDVISNQTCINRYTITRTYKATDANGNTATCTQVITVYDNTAPVLSAAPANVTVQCSAVPQPATLTATDNCTGTVTVTPSSSITPGSCQNAYTIIRVWTATDVCGLTASVSQTVTVIDNTPPTITCPATITVACISSIPAPNTTAVTAADNCSGTVAVTFAGDSINMQSTLVTRTYLATDECGNTATCTQLIMIVTTNNTPTITCPPAITVQCASNVPAPAPASLPVTNGCVNTCLSFCTYTQGAYGSAGGLHSNGLNTTQTLDILLQNDTIFIGSGTCGLQVTTTACVLGILPAGGPSIPLAQNYVLDCTQPINNTLVGQLITLQLNVLYNLEFNNNFHLEDAALTCVLTPAEIAALGLGISATVEDLIELANTYLASNCNGTTYANGFGGTLAAATGAINEYWDECQNPITGGFGTPPTVAFVSDVISNQTCVNRYKIIRTYQATNANGNTATCTQMITVYDNTPPVGVCPADITVGCIGSVPCGNNPGPALTALMQQIQAAYTDNCGPVTVSFLSASDLEACSDPDGDGIFTFGRTFYFQVADACGNVTLCDVAYTGNCQAFCTYTQGAYGSAGGTHSNGLNTTQTLNVLLQSGPIVIGSGTCGFQVSTTACVLGILPAGGPSVPLPQNFVLNCNQPINNTLVGQLITVLLNVRYNLVYNNGLNLAALQLSCIFTAQEIAALGLTASSTVNDLTALANTFLASNCNGTTYPSGFGGGLTSALTEINERWDECQQTDPCTGSIVEPGGSILESGKIGALHIYPNPAVTLVNMVFTTDAATTAQVRFLNTEGRLMYQLQIDMKKGDNATQIDVSSLPAGLYLIDLTSDRIKVTERLVIIRP